MVIIRQDQEQARCISIRSTEKREEAKEDLPAEVKNRTEIF